MVKETNTKRHCAVAVIRTSPIPTDFSCYSSHLPNIIHGSAFSHLVHFIVLNHSTM